MPDVPLNVALNDSSDQHGNLSMTVSGPWIESILWEVPLMSTLCEIYYKHVDTDWTYEGQEGE